MPISPYDGYTAGSNWIRANQPVVVTNVSALRALDKTKISYAVTKGYYTAGDGGAGEYWYDSSDTTSVDNGGTIIVASDGGRWKLKYGYGIFVKQFGAKLDSATDDTSAITAADSVASTLGVPLYFRGGVGMCGRISFSGGSRSWIGDGKSGIKLLSTLYSTDTSPAFSGSFANNRVIFKDLILDQNWTNTTYPSGYSRNDAYKASSWGGGGWFAIFDGNQTSTVKFINCFVRNVFRGFLVKTQKDFVVDSCDVNCESSLGDSVFASELCTTVLYTKNRLFAKDWYTSNGVSTGGNGLFGNTCRNVTITDNYTKGFQLVFHATEPGASDIGMGVRCIVSGNTIEYPPADTAFYRWCELNVTANNIHKSGDNGIAVSGSSLATVTGNVVRGCNVGGIGVTACRNVTITGNTVVDYAQDYSLIQTLGGRLVGNSGVWKSGITCDYQANGQQGLMCVISGNTIGMDNLPPVSDAAGAVRAETLGIYIDITSNTASQSTFSITGNYLISDQTNLPKLLVFAPSHRFYIATGGKTGTPVVGEIFTNGVNSFVYLSDFGAGNLCFIKKLSGTIPTATAFTGGTSGATIISANPLPQLTWTQIVGAGNFDFTTTYLNQNVGP